MGLNKRLVYRVSDPFTSRKPDYQPKNAMFTGSSPYVSSAPDPWFPRELAEDLPGDSGAPRLVGGR